MIPVTDESIKRGGHWAGVLGDKGAGTDCLALIAQIWRWLGIDLNREPTVGGFARFTCRQLRTILTFYVVLFYSAPLQS